MNQAVQFHLKPKNENNGSLAHNYLQLKKNNKSKEKINSVASKSFSEAFMKQYSSRRSNTQNKQSNKLDIRKQPIVHELEHQRKNKKYSQMHGANNNYHSVQKDKKKQLLLNALDNKIAKNSSLKTKSQNHRASNSLTNISHYHNQSYRYPPSGQIYKNANNSSNKNHYPIMQNNNRKSKEATSNNHLKINNSQNHHQQVQKYKSESNILEMNMVEGGRNSNERNHNNNSNYIKGKKNNYKNQYKNQQQIIKSISSTIKHQNQNNNKVLTHLQKQKQSKRKNYLTFHHPQYHQQQSISERKKISQKLEQKFNEIVDGNKYAANQRQKQFQDHVYLTKKQKFKSQMELIADKPRALATSERKLHTYQKENSELSNNNNGYKSLNKQQKYLSSSGLEGYPKGTQHKMYANNFQHEQQPRLQFKFAFRTRKGQHVNNPKKVNQDSILVKQNIGKKDIHMIAVADGHGPSGHFVSQFVIKALSKHFSDQINEIIKFENEKISNNASQRSQLHLPIQPTLFLPKIYDKIQTELSCSQINSATSGCTLVNVIIKKQQILCANVGDSRAILARQMDKKNWQLIYLSEDHKPENQIEKKRILKCGGRIHSFKGQKGQNLGPLRVWLPNQNMQGLAMTRSFGDNISKSVGVTHKPQMIKVKLDQQNDKFILVASDGVWQFITNQQILQLIVPFYKDKKLQQACDALLKLSYQRWTQGDDSVVDDISFVLIFLHC